MVLSTFAVLYNHYHYLVPELSHHPKRNLWTSPSPLPSPPAHWQPWIHFPLLWICQLWLLHINGIIGHKSIRAWASSTVHYVVEVHPHCGLCQCRTHFYGSMTRHCVERWHCLFSCWWAFVLFPPHGYCEWWYYEHWLTNVCLNIYFQFFSVYT